MADWLEFLSPFLRGLILATGIGLILGLEREHNARTEPGHLAGLRTFPLLAILGFLVGYFGRTYENRILLVAFGGLFLLVAVAYFAQARQGKFGLTTEFALLINFLLGGMVAYEHYGESMAVAVVVTALLSLKEEFHRFVDQITETEMFAFIKFFVLALLVLPILPNEQFGPNDLLNYRDLGWIIIIVSTISFAGYLALKFAGSQKGILFTAFLGGLYSSTMIAWIFAARSQELKGLSKPLAAGIILSSSIMFGRVLFLSWLFNPALGARLIVPCLVLLLVSGVVVWRIMFHQKKGQQVDDFPLGNPLDIRNALFFGALYIAVTLFMFYAREWMGDSGAYLTSALSGMADIDVITISTAKWAQADQLALAANMVVIAMMSNTVFKFVATLLRGHASLRPMLLQGFGVVLLTGITWLLLFGRIF
jgi:uncharacterized membrane protein (DUF4010 family)